MLTIGIAGGSGSGKTTVVKKIVDSLPSDSVVIVSQDSYYKDNGCLTAEERAQINFDHPDSIEFDLLDKHINDLKANKVIHCPTYSYVTCARQKETIPIHPCKVLIVEGILIFTHKQLRKHFDIKVFVDADPDDRLMRIVRRDILERGRNYEQALQHYELYVKTMHQQFIEPTKRYADLIVPQGGENNVAIELMSARIAEYLRKKN
ncbi:MAG: uridine kinase [Bacteroidales bacterium]|nr:uridine kinase [Bacteroidales bacterium]